MTASSSVAEQVSHAIVRKKHCDGQDSSVRRLIFCRKCEGHDVKVRSVLTRYLSIVVQVVLKGHAASCPYSDCVCEAVRDFPRSFTTFKYEKKLDGDSFSAPM